VVFAAGSFKACRGWEGGDFASAGWAWPICSQIVAHLTLVGDQNALRTRLPSLRDSPLAQGPASLSGRNTLIGGTGGEAGLYRPAAGDRIGFTQSGCCSVARWPVVVASPSLSSPWGRSFLQGKFAAKKVPGEFGMVLVPRGVSLRMNQPPAAGLRTSNNDSDGAVPLFELVQVRDWPGPVDGRRLAGVELPVLQWMWS